MIVTTLSATIEVVTQEEKVLKNAENAFLTNFVQFKTVWTFFIILYTKRGETSAPVVSLGIVDLVDS